MFHKVVSNHWLLLLPYHHFCCWAVAQSLCPKQRCKYVHPSPPDMLLAEQSPPRGRDKYCWSQVALARWLANTWARTHIHGKLAPPCKAGEAEPRCALVPFQEFLVPHTGDLHSRWSQKNSAATTFRFEHSKWSLRNGSVWRVPQVRQAVGAKCGQNDQGQQ